MLHRQQPCQPPRLAARFSMPVIRGHGYSLDSWDTAASYLPFQIRPVMQRTHAKAEEISTGTPSIGTGKILPDPPVLVSSTPKPLKKKSTSITDKQDDATGATLLSKDCSLHILSPALKFLHYYSSAATQQEGALSSQRPGRRGQSFPREGWNQGEVRALYDIIPRKPRSSEYRNDAKRCKLSCGLSLNTCFDFAAL